LDPSENSAPLLLSQAGYGPVSNQPSVFTTAVSEVVDTDFHETLLKQPCSAGHFIFELIIQTAFNCCAKNKVKRLNTAKNAPDILCGNRKIRN